MAKLLIKLLLLTAVCSSSDARKFLRYGGATGEDEMSSLKLDTSENRVLVDVNNDVSEETGEQNIFTYNDIPLTFEDLVSIDLPPISMSLSTTKRNGEVDTVKLSSMFSGYLMEYLHMEMPARYDIRDVSLITNYFMENGTMHELFVTGQVSLVDSDDVDVTKVNQVLSSTLLTVFNEYDFVDVMKNADDKVLRSTTEVKLALLKGMQKQTTINALHEEDQEGGSHDKTYLIIACTGFGVALLLLGCSIHYALDRRRSRKSRRGRKRSNYRSSRRYSPNNRRGDDSHYDDVGCDIPGVDEIVDAVSSFFTSFADDDSVKTTDVENNACSFGGLFEPKSRTRSSSMPPPRRPYPYPATEPDKKGHVRQKSQPSDMALAVKSQRTNAADIREEWNSDGVAAIEVSN